MGTNYYATGEKPCLHCGRGGGTVHIGKSSAGWCFSLATHPDLGINTLDDWKAFWADKIITDEYGIPHTAADMLATITERTWDYKRSMSKNDMDMNGAEPGPNGLLRHKVDRFCTGHGEGTWDYVAGEFC